MRFIISEATIGEAVGADCFAFGRRQVAIPDKPADFAALVEFLKKHGRKGQCVDAAGHAACGEAHLRTSGDCNILMKFPQAGAPNNGGGGGKGPAWQCCAKDELTALDREQILLWASDVEDDIQAMGF